MPGIPGLTEHLFSLLWKESSSSIQLCFGRRRFGGPIFLTSAPLCASSVLRFLAPLKHETWRSWLMISARIFRWKILLNSQGFLGISCSQSSDLILNIKSPYIPDSSKNYTQTERALAGVHGCTAPQTLMYSQILWFILTMFSKWECKIKFQLRPCTPVFNILMHPLPKICSILLDLNFHW